MSSGLVFLAQKTGIPVMLLHVDYSAYWELKSWDGFRVPKPFSSVRVRMLRPCTVPAVEDAEMLERERKRLEDRLSGSFSEAPDYLDAIASMN
jgi:hypothetical protein